MGNPRYPKAEWTPTGLDGGAHIGGPPRGVWHETITAPSEFFTATTYYHIQVRQWPLTAKPQWRQFIGFDRASRALRNIGPGKNPTGDRDVQTNRMGRVNINVALVGYQEAKANGFPSLYPLTDAMVNDCWEFVEWAADEWGIPADVSALISEPGHQEYGYEAPLRMTADEWERFTGWCGHERVVENTHHDPHWRFGVQLKHRAQGADEVTPTQARIEVAAAWYQKAGVWMDGTTGENPQVRLTRLADAYQKGERTIEDIVQYVGRIRDPQPGEAVPAWVLDPTAPYSAPILGGSGAVAPHTHDNRYVRTGQPVRIS